MRARDRIVVIGASGFGRESLDVVQAMQENGAALEIVGVIDDSPSAANLDRLANRDVSYLGTIEEWLDTNVTGIRFVLGIGNPNVRRKLAKQLESLGLSPFPAIHPSAAVGSHSELGPGVVVCAGATISTNVRLKRYVHVNPNATIGHDSVLGEFVSINPAAVVSGEVEIGEGVLVGAASIILQQLTVGPGTVVGAAALVTKNIPANVVVKGAPGRWVETSDEI